MNGTSLGSPASRSGDGLDPDLIQLFDAANAPPHAEAFVSAMLTKLAAARRARLIRRCISIAVVMVLGALLAPYVAQATVTTAGWVAERLSTAVLAIASCACATLIAWRTARRGLG